MIRTTLHGPLLVAALFAFAAPAHALSPRYELEHANTCTRNEGNPTTIEAAEANLMAGTKVHSALKMLDDQGPDGCAAIARWVTAGAPGGSDDQLEKVGTWLIHGDDPAGWSAALLLTGHEDEDVAVHAATLLTKRLFELDRAEAELLVESKHDEVRKLATGLFAGLYCIAESDVITTNIHFVGLPFPIVTVDHDDAEWWATTVEVPPAHAHGMALLADDRDDDVREQVARAIGQAYLLELSAAPNYEMLLHELIGDRDEEVAERAAFFAGRSSTPNGSWLLDKVIEEDEDELLEAFVEGLEMRVQWGIPNEHTVSRARHIADEGLGYKAKASNIASRAETKMEKEAAARERWRVMTGEKKPVGGDVEEDEEKKIKKTE